MLPGKIGKWDVHVGHEKALWIPENLEGHTQGRVLYILRAVLALRKYLKGPKLSSQAYCEAVLRGSEGQTGAVCIESASDRMCRAPCRQWGLSIQGVMEISVQSYNWPAAKLTKQRVQCHTQRRIQSLRISSEESVSEQNKDD